MVVGESVFSPILRRFALWPCLAVVLGTFAVRAQDADLPAYTILNCGKSCGIRTDPKPIGERHGEFPAGWGENMPGTESYVVIRLTSAADGSVQDPVVERLIGPSKFADTALEFVKTWRYQPATVNGKAVARLNWMVQVQYLFNPPVLGARQKVYDAYRAAQELIDANKFDEANAVLLPILSLEDLNFYERCMVSLLLARSYLASQDYLTAREYIINATLDDGLFLSKPGLVSAVRLRIRLDALTGQYADAFEWFDKLKKHATLDADDSDAKLVGILHARLDDPRPIAVSGVIPVTEYLPIWTHTLLRRHFAFSALTGKLDRFELLCDQQKIASPITTAAEWHVPQDWSNCSLDVFGEAGAKFRVVESNE
jgi:TonB family protein